MYRKIKMMGLFLLAFALQAQAQTDEYSVFITDGKNASFGWGRQISYDKIAVGLSDEGLYQLRDSSIWLVSHPDREDARIAYFKQDENLDKIIFIIANAAEEHEKFFTFGAYDPITDELFDKNNELLGKINKSGEITAPNGQCYLRFNFTENKPDKSLTVFFVLYHYLQLQKKL